MLSPLVPLLVVFLLQGLHTATAQAAREKHVKNENEQLTVKTRSGLVQGKREFVDQKPVDVFLGIPFAQPPVGDLRFKKPSPISYWTDVLPAKKHRNSCQQEPSTLFPGFRGETMWNPNTPISEDCLYLNIWVPASLRNSKNATVLVWIHGGGYTSGSSSLEIYDGAILASTGDVIVASVNYRLGVFGFLHLDHEEAPGNMGLYDQALAIQWIRDNIRHFGGDPDSITLFGESAGAGSVSSHLLSPVSRHLFKRAIMQSGSVNAPWSYMTSSRAKKFAVQLIEAVGCNPLLDPPAVMKCMRNVEARNLSISQFVTYEGIMDVHWGPTIDGRFLPNSPAELLAEGKFIQSDLLLGSNKDEGSMMIMYDFPTKLDKDRPTALDEHQFHEMLDKTFDQWSSLDRKVIKIQYSNMEKTRNDTFFRQIVLSDVVGDSCFVCPIQKYAQKFADDGGSVFYYHFNQRTSSNPWGEWLGVLHADEIDYVFGVPLNPSSNYTEGERALSRRVISFFSMFAKTGKPTLDDSWPTYSSENPDYYVLNETAHNVVERGLRATYCAFWNEMMPVIQAQQQCPIEKACDCDASITN